VTKLLLENKEMSTIQEVNSAIMFGDFTDEQLRSVSMAIQFRRNQIGKETKRELRLGTRVQFTNSRTGQVVQGSVGKINIKYVMVNSNGTTWRVPANMLTVI
jgi:predicted phage gp36 major capsid-like protein